MHAYWNLALVFALTTPPFALAQGASTPPPPSATATIANPTAKPILFEVVSVRPVKSNVVYGKTFTDDGFSMRGITPWSLITFYSEHDSDRIEGVPDWAQHEQYDIEAKVAEADVVVWAKLDNKQRRLALYGLLEDRFKLKVHRETRQSSGYALVIGKNGPKFKEATPGEIYPVKLRSFSGGPFHGITVSGPGEVTAQAASMQEVANMMQSFAHAAVLDKTGLIGKYDFVFKFPTQPGPSASRPAEDSTAVEPTGFSIFTLLQEDLGLKLEKSTVPVNFIVVDHIERPSEN